MVALIAAGAAVAYVAGMLATARWLFGRWRPATEPIYCKHFRACERYGHDSSCYRATLTGLDQTETAVFSTVCGLIWPVALIFFGLFCMVTAGHRPRREEVQAATERLEKEAGL